MAEAARALAKQFLERSGPYLDLVSRKETVEKEAHATLINVSAVSQDIARLFAELTEYQVLLEKEEARHTQYRAEIAAIEERISNPDTLEMIEGAQYYSFFKVQTEMANKIENASS